MFDQKTMQFDAQIRSAMKKIGTLRESANSDDSADRIELNKFITNITQSLISVSNLIKSAMESHAITRLITKYSDNYHIESNILEELSDIVDKMEEPLAGLEYLASGDYDDDNDDNDSINSSDEDNDSASELNEDEAELEGKYANLQPIGSLPKPEGFLKLFKSKKYDWMFKVYEGEEDEDGDINFVNLKKDMSELKSKGWKTYNVDNESEDFAAVIYFKPGAGKVTDGDEFGHGSKG